MLNAAKNVYFTKTKISSYYIIYLLEDFTFKFCCHYNLWTFWSKLYFAAFKLPSQFHEIHTVCVVCGMLNLRFILKAIFFKTKHEKNSSVKVCSIKFCFEHPRKLTPTNCG